ncbi:MAG: hypothetical protein ACRD2H_03265 [Terriglobales bacterium]
MQTLKPPKTTSGFPGANCTSELAFSTQLFAPRAQHTTASRHETNKNALRMRNQFTLAEVVVVVVAVESGLEVDWLDATDCEGLLTWMHPDALVGPPALMERLKPENSEFTK